MMIQVYIFFLLPLYKYFKMDHLDIARFAFEYDNILTRWAT